MVRMTRWVTAAVAMAAAASLAACAGGGSASTGTGDASSTLRLSIAAPPSNFSIGNWSGGDSTLAMSVYDSLIHREVDGSLNGGLAESWEYDESATNLTLHLREGVSFSNGEPLDAAAVVANVEVLRAGSSTAQNLASVSSVAAPDDSTVVIGLSEPDAAIVPLLSNTNGLIGAPSVLTAESSQLAPVGSGPYTLNEQKTVAGAKYVLDKNADFYDAADYPFETVEIQVIQDPTAVQNAMKAGQLDSAGLSSEDLIAQFPESEFTTGQNKPSTVGALWLVDREGTIVPALKDERVRRAINLAFDRTAIAEGLGSGYLNASEQIVSPTGGAWDDELNGAYDYDVDQAKQLLAEAGYADGFDVTMPSTVVSTKFESAIGQALADIGVTVTWESVPFQDFYSKVFGGSYGMFFMMNGLGGSDALDVNASLSGVFNPYLSTTPELESLLAAANLSQDEEAFAPVNEYLVDQAWFAPLFYITSLYVVSNDVEYTSPVVGNLTVQPWSPNN